MPPVVYLLKIRVVGSPAFVSIERLEYRENMTCQDHNMAKWHTGNMSIISTGGCSFRFDWAQVLVYFNADFTLGVITECSSPEKIRHVLYSPFAMDNPLPTKTEVQDVVMQYEGDTIHLNDTFENFKTFPYKNKSIPKCFCSNDTHPQQKSHLFGDFRYVILVCFLLFSLLSLWFSCLD